MKHYNKKCLKKFQKLLLMISRIFCVTASEARKSAKKLISIYWRGFFVIAVTEAATRGVLRNFLKFTGKHLCQGLRVRPKACNFI